MSQLDIDLQEKIQSLQDAILNTHPRLPIILRDIHTMLKNDPAIVTLMSEEEISILVNGLKQQTKISITESAAKKKVSLKGVSLADL